MSHYEEALIQVEVPIVVEEGSTSWGAFAPSVPGCISVGSTREEAERNMAEALAFHLRGIHRDELATSAAAEDDSELERLAAQVNETMSLDDAAKLAGVSLSAITNAIREGKLTVRLIPPGAPPARGRRTRLVYRDEIERWRRSREERLQQQLARLTATPV